MDLNYLAQGLLRNGWKDVHNLTQNTIQLLWRVLNTGGLA